MSNCVYCAEKAGLFSNEHKACKEKADAELSRGALQVERAIVNDLPANEVIESLTAIRKAGRLDPHRGVKEVWLRKADDAAMARSHQEPISPAKFENIGTLIEYLEPNFFYLGRNASTGPELFHLITAKPFTRSCMASRLIGQME